MCWFKWIVCIVALFAADIRTETLKHKGLSPRRCFHCVHNVTNNCDQKTRLPVLCPVGQPVCATVASAPRLSPRRCFHCVHNVTNNCDQKTRLPVLCPVGQPVCATVASTPNFTSTLTCSVASESPCLLKFNFKSALELTCTCINPLCNLPYSSHLRNEIFKFLTSIQSNTSAELTEAFLKSSVFANVTKAKLYEMITDAGEATVIPSVLSVQSTTIGLVSIDVEEIKPRVEALKQATVPPDDEDDDEGSGSFEESKSHAAAPAAPSSFLPAEENNVSPITLNNYLLLALIYLNIIV